MPIYARQCKSCEHIWDHLTLSFSGAKGQEKEGVECPECGSKETERSFDLHTTNPLPKRYGVHTYL
jgi:putative FmdB family regulatory protein